MNRRAQRASDCRGAVMTEFVLVLPLLVLIIALVMFFGQALARSQRNIVMARYDTWRAADGAPGPSAGLPDHALLNETFFNSAADSIDAVYFDDWFAGEPYRWWMEQIDLQMGQGDAFAMADSLLGLPQGGYRLPHGVRRGYATGFAGDSGLARRLATPVVAVHHRLAMDWRYTIDWRAGEPVWAANVRRAFGENVMRAARDVFLVELDGGLEDGDNALMQHLRDLYLTGPDYRGPIVDDES